MTYDLEQDPYGRGAWAKFLEMASFLTIKGLNPLDIQQAIKADDEKSERIVRTRQVAAQETRSAWSRYGKLCPSCAIVMGLQPVNTGPGDQTGDDSKAVWLCPKCLDTIYVSRTPKEILQDLLILYRREN